MCETTQKGIENGRASFAFECAKSVSENLKKAYKSHVKSFPMLVKTNGLGASIAFLFSKKEKENGVYSLIGKHICDWLIKDRKYSNYGIGNLTNLESLSENIIKIDSSQYRTLTVEVLALFTWLRRFAEGLAEEGEWYDLLYTTRYDESW